MDKKNFESDNHKTVGLGMIYPDFLFYFSRHSISDPLSVGFITFNLIRSSHLRILGWTMGFVRPF